VAVIAIAAAERITQHTADVRQVDTSVDTDIRALIDLSRSRIHARSRQLRHFRPVGLGDIGLRSGPCHRRESAGAHSPGRHAGTWPGRCTAVGSSKWWAVTYDDNGSGVSRVGPMDVNTTMSTTLGTTRDPAAGPTTSAATGAEQLVRLGLVAT
jgi:hypothetical protein